MLSHQRSRTAFNVQVAIAEEKTQVAIAKENTNKTKGTKTGNKSIIWIKMRVIPQGQINLTFPSHHILHKLKQNGGKK